MNPNLLIFRALCRIVTAGSKKHVSYEAPLPDGPKIFASAHPTNVDPAYFYHLMGDPALMVMKWGFDLPVLGRIMRNCGHISVGSGHAAYSAALNELLKGRNVYICPEGKLSEPGARPKTGAVRLAIQAGVPIIPVGIKHCGVIRNLNICGHVVRFMPFGVTKIRFGLPWDLEMRNLEYAHHKYALDIIMQVMREVRELSE